MVLRESRRVPRWGSHDGTPRAKYPRLLLGYPRQGVLGLLPAPGLRGESTALVAEPLGGVICLGDLKK